MSNIEAEWVTETIIRWADGSVHIKAGNVDINWPGVKAVADDPNGFADFAANIAVALNEGKVKPKRPYQLQPASEHVKDWCDDCQAVQPYYRKVSPSPVTEGVA